MHGHDAHFLSRLTKRADDATVERAMRLYRDRELVMRLVAEATQGAAAGAAGASATGGAAAACGPDERVAIALGPGEIPPTVIVAANGRFVTCLAAGMAHDLVAQVPWERAELHLRLDDAADAIAGLKAEGALRRMLRKINRAGFRLSREEIREYRAIAPIAWVTWSEQLIDVTSDFFRWLAEAARLRNLRDDDPLCTQIWRAYHAIAHYTILPTLAGRYAMDSWFADDHGASYYETQLWRLIFLNEGPLAIRSLWAAAQGGERVLAMAATGMAEATSWHAWRCGALTTLTIGAVHPELAATAIERVRAGRAPEEDQNDAIRIHATAIRDMAGWACRRAEDLSPEEVSGFRSWAGARCIEYSFGGDPSPLVDARGWTTLDMARRLRANFEEHLHGYDELLDLLRALPFIASMKPEDFFHPAADAARIEVGYSFDLVDRLVDRFRAARPQPRRVEKTIGRNDPCNCGSGRKYKKCCGGA